MHKYIRHAKSEDISRIAEIIITNYRVNFYPFFKNYEFYFKEPATALSLQEKR